jgi:FO synthase subunit 2
MNLEAVLGGVTPGVRAVLEAALDGRELSLEDGLLLCAARGADLTALCATADELRRRQVGDTVTYVVNRNINFTNVCVKACKFCAFSRGHRSDQSYFLDEDEVVRRAAEAVAMGATEVCIQAGLPPNADGRIYIDLCRAVKRALPEVHVHAFSPEEVKYGAGLLGVPFAAYLAELKDAGLGSLPGTSAEILDDTVRARIAPGRITTSEWVDVIRSAHALGLPTTSTIMFGHVESDAERLRHLLLLRSIQRETGGFTELVPLSFVHEEAPMFARSQIPGLRPGPTGNEVIRLYAIARLLLGAHIRNLQVSWVKDGLRLGQHLLACGANDLGGTRINESISTAAGASHGQLLPPSALRRAIRDAGRLPAERNTRYRILREFPPGAPEPPEPLDLVEDPEAAFGSYAVLSRDPRFRFKPRAAAEPHSPK